jgi:GNAT superfamily N-acetyltransferase
MPGNDIEIRLAKAGDLEQLWPQVENFAFSYRPERSAFGRSFSDFLDRSDTLVLVAVSDAEAVVGYLLGSFHGTFFANGPVAWTEELMVGEPLRGMGVASKLMSSAEEWARSPPATYIALASRRAADESPSGASHRPRVRGYLSFFLKWSHLSTCDGV